MAAPMIFLKQRTLFAFLANFCVVSSLSKTRPNKIDPSVFATKTAYDSSFSVSEKIKRESVWSQLQQNKCQVVQLNMVIRHGTRYPSSGDTVNAVNVMDRIRGKVTTPELKHINEWNVPFQEYEPRDLSPVGVQELYQMGKRIASSFSGMFGDSTEEEILFQSSSYDRAKDSSTAFQDGFMGDKNNKGDTPLDLRDDILRYYDSCPKHIYEVIGSKDAMKEFQIFKRGAHMKGVAERVKKRLGIHDENFSYSDLKAIYTMTSGEMNEYGNSVWSDVWHPKDLKIMEYAGDLKAYWRKGFGYRLNYEQSCPLLSHIFEHMDAAVTKGSTRYKKGVFRFGHSESLVPLLSLLGLFKDNSDLRADNFNEMKGRKFRTSIISPFAANIAIVLHKCDNDRHEKDGQEDSFHVQILVNEKPIKLPFCDSYMCPYSEFKDHYKKHVDSCDLQAMCELSKHKKDEF